jgi:hypothetical protein
LKTLVLLCLLCGVARAEIYIVDPDRPPPEPPTHTRLFGFRIGGGILPVRDTTLDTLSLALMVEHRAHGKWRIAGEYEYAWLGVRDDEMDGLVDGNGHRASLSIRRAMLESRRLIQGTLRFYADLELGGGFMLATEPTTGTLAVPHGFAGVRLGYRFIKLHRETRASPVWEPELVVRAIATRHDAPLGLFAGVGINWGD